MRRSILVVAAAAAVVLAVAPGALAGSWRFAPTINAPWTGETNSALDTPLQAVGLCRSAPFNTSSAYAATLNVDMIVGDPINNSGASNLGCSTPQNETTVAVNPTNPNNLVAGANDYRVCCDFTGLNDGTGWAYHSFDGGATWHNVLVPGLTAETGGSGNFQRVDSAGDPALAFGPDGTLYYANIVFSRTSFASGVAVSTSHDGGISWSAPNMVSYVDSGNYFNDKEWIAAGPNGRVVVTWTSFSLGPHGAGYLSSPIVAAFSKDGGKTWNRQGWPVSDAAHPFDQGSFPQFGPDGTLYVAYEGGTPSSGYSQDATVVARSTDGGTSFSNTEVGRVYDDLDCYPVFGGRQTLTGEQFRLNSYSSFSVDPVTGKLAIVWADNQHSGNCGTGGTSFTGTTAAQVKLVSGAWGALSAPATITSGADKVFPAVAARGGVIAVSYYTRDYAGMHDPATCKVAIGSTDPGPQPVPVASSVCLDYASSSSRSAYAETRLTTEGSNPYVQFANGSFIGDYSQIALGSDGVAHPVWTDFRGRPGVTAANQDVYTQAFRP
jgi:hypothetical protein